MGPRARELTYCVILLSLVLGGIGQVLLKAGASTLDTEGGAAGAFGTVTAGLLHPLVLMGLVAYAASSGLWLIVLSRVQLSVAYPLAAVNHVIVAVAAVTLGETLPLARWLGVGLVAAGVALLGLSDLRDSATPRMPFRRGDPRPPARGAP